MANSKAYRAVATVEDYQAKCARINEEARVIYEQAWHEKSWDAVFDAIVELMKANKELDALIFDTYHKVLKVAQGR